MDGCMWNDRHRHQQGNLCRMPRRTVSGHYVRHTHCHQPAFGRRLGRLLSPLDRADASTTPSLVYIPSYNLIDAVFPLLLVALSHCHYIFRCHIKLWCILYLWKLPCHCPYTISKCCLLQGRTGDSNRPWLSRQTGPTSSVITRNSGDPCTNIHVQTSLPP